MTKEKLLKLLLKEERRAGRGKFLPKIIERNKAPMIAQDMPDYRKFCAGYPADCEQCREYSAEQKNGLFCLLWEKIFSGEVRWHEKGKEHP